VQVAVGVQVAVAPDGADVDEQQLDDRQDDHRHGAQRAVKGDRQGQYLDPDRVRDVVDAVSRSWDEVEEVSEGGHEDNSLPTRGWECG
jgi:hypothetical protein